ncbi:MAG: chitobiase/beta-hexosaminidase C-terminal domain-containing protein, partial [Elusimicrobiales bacterium]
MSNTDPIFRSDGYKTGLKSGNFYSNPTTDFVFNQWNTRINKDFSGLAYRSQDAAYPDGEYALLAVAESVDRNPAEMFVSTPVYVGIDNFRPYLEEVRVMAEDLPGMPVVRRHTWLLENNLLIFSELKSWLVPGEYTLSATFSEEMNGDSVYLGIEGKGALPGKDVYFSTETRKSIASGRLSISPAEYPRDTVTYVVAAGTDIARKELLAISTATNKTIDPALTLTRNAAGEMQGEGGYDTSMELRIEVSSPIITWFADGNYHNCPGECGSQAQPLIFTSNGVWLDFSDLGSGLAWMGVYRITETGSVFHSSQAYTAGGEVQYNVPTAIKQLEDGKYQLVVLDKSGKTTTMNLLVDPVSPRVEISSVVVEQPFTPFSLYGVVQDTGSGVDYLTLTRNDVLIRNFNVPAGATAPVPFAAQGLGISGDGYYVLKARDKGGTESPVQLLQFLHLAGVNIVPSPVSPHSIIGTHVTGISAAGDPCEVTLRPAPLVSEVPVLYSGSTAAITATLPAATTVQTSIYSGSEYFSGALTMSVTQKCSDGNCSPACSVQVQGSHLLGFLLGPTVSISRNSDFTNTAFYNFGTFTAEFSDYQPLPGETPSLTVGGARVPPPFGDVIYPTNSGLGLEMKLSGATYSSLKVQMRRVGSDIADGDLVRAKMLQYGDDGSITDITTARTRDYIEGVTHHNSVFAVSVPVGVFDKAGPVVSLTGAAPAADGTVYLSSTTRIGFDAADVSTNAYVLAGMASTYFLLDAGPTPECLATPYNPLAAPGTCANHFYYETFSTTEGVHSLYYQGIDNAGNLGEPVIVTLRSDGTPPAAELALNGAPIIAGSTVYATAADTITLSAADVLSNGVASGLATTYFLIDISPEECDYLEWSGGLNGMGTCENRYYGGPFSLPAGEHVLYFYGEDKVGNTEPLRTVYVMVGEDTTPPQSSLRFVGPQVALNGRNYISTSAAVELLSSDEGTGVATTYYLVDADPSLTLGTEYSSPFTMEEGSHTLHYRAVDKAGNYEVWNSTIIYVDGTGPASWHSIAGLALSIDGYNYVSVNSTVSVGALDQEIKGAAAGVESVYLSINGSPSVVNSTYTVIPSSEGIHGLGYYAVDRLGNIGGAGAYAWRVDATAPKTWHEVVGASYTAGGLLYLKAGAALFLQRQDPVSNGVASGAQDTWYSLDSGVDVPYGMTPLILTEGPHTLGYFTSDKAGNYEAENSTAVYVDGTAPVLELKAARALYSETNAWYGTSRDTFTLSAADAGSGLRSLELSLNDGVFTPAVGGAFNLAFAAEGRNKVVARAFDNLGNEAGATYYLIIDDTPPDFSGSRQIRWEAEDPSNTITPAGSLVLGDGGLKLYTGVAISTVQQTVLFSGDSLPALSTPAWSRGIMGTPYTFTETITNGIYKVSGAGYGGNGISHWRSEPTFIPSMGWSFEMRPRLLPAGGDNSAGFYVSEGNGYYIWLQFRSGHVWVSLVPRGDVYLSLDTSNFHTGKLAREGDYLRFYVDGLLKVSAYYPTPAGLPSQPAAKPFLNSFSVSYGNFGSELDWMKYTFFGQGAVPAGALSGVFETPFIPLGEVSAVRNFVASSEAGGGALKYEYTTDGSSYKDVSRLSEADVAAGRIKLRGTLTRAAAADESPVSDAMNFELARLVETSTPIAGPFGGPAGIKFIASERTTAAPAVEVAVGAAAAGAAGDADNVPPSLIWRYNYNVPEAAPSGEGVISIEGSDLSGNAGSDGSGRITIDALGPEPVAGLALTERSTYSVTLAWPATTDRGAAGEIKDYLVGYSTWTGGLAAASAGLVAAAGPAGATAMLEGLAPGTTYYAAVWARDVLGNVSEVSNVVSTVTLGFGISSDGLASIITPGINMTVETLPPDSLPAAPAFAAMPGVGLEPAQGGIYELTPSGKVFDTPAKLTFYFDPAVVSTDTLAIYYFDGVAWASAPVTGQTFGLLPDGRGYVEGYIAHSSLYALLYRLDVQPPRSALAPEVFYRGAEGTVYVTGRDTFTFTSADDRLKSGDGDGYGVPEQALKVNGSGSSREARFFNAAPARGVVFVSTFGLSGEADGLYTLNYSAEDVFANVETSKSGLFAVDNTPPAVSPGVDGPSYAAPEALYAGPGSAFTLAGADVQAGGVASGLKEVLYKLDDGAWKAYAGALEVSQLAEGPHVLSYYARDNAGNKAAVAALPITADFTPPVTRAVFDGAEGLNGWYLSPVGVALNAADAGSGVAGLLYALDAAGEAPYAGAFGVEAEGVHSLRYHASDRVGNAEAPKTSQLKIDRTAPNVAAAAARAPNAAGWDNAPVFVDFTGADAVSGLDYCVKGSTLASEGAGQSVSGYCMDYAGWSSTVTLAVNIDTTAPKVTYVETPAANAAGWHNTAVEVRFSGTDALSGVDYCSPAATAASEGAGIELSGSCDDKAGNTGGVTARLNIDMTPPVLTIASPLAGQTYIATRGNIAINFAVKDNLDPAPAAEAWLVQTEDRGSPRGARPARIAVAAGQSIEPLGIDDGLWRLEVNGADAAGNTAALQ